MADGSIPLNLSSDYALDFANSASDGSDGDSSEDPVGRGQSRAGKKDMFRTPAPRPGMVGRIKTPGQPGGSIPNLTPGARRIDP